MKIKHFHIFTTFALFAVTCSAAGITHQVSPGIGTFEDSGSASSLSIEETSDGFRVGFFLDAATTNEERPILEPFAGSWESETWTSVIFDELKSSGEFDTIIKFNPFDEPDGRITPLVTGTQVTLPPSTTNRGRPYDFVAFVCDGFCSPGSVSIEYSVTMIDPPLGGDFNHDSIVDMEDFMVLSGNYGNRGSWKDGDATLDSTVGFDDFLILSANFGAMEGPAIASVPEPNANGMLIYTLCGVSVFFTSRRKRRR